MIEQRLYTTTMIGITILTLLTTVAGAIPYEEWNRTYYFCDDSIIGYCSESINSVQQTKDEGFIFTGSSYYDDDYNPWSMVILFKTDKKGNIQWKRNFSGSWDGYTQQTKDGGYILVSDPGIPFFTSILLSKLDSKNIVQWEKTYEFGEYQLARSLQQTKDEGFIFTCSVGDCCGPISYHILVKTNSGGNIQWNMTFEDHGYGAPSVQQTVDSGYIIVQETKSNSTNSYDILLIKIDSNGNKLWNKTFGDTFQDFANSVQQTIDGGYIIAGMTRPSITEDGDALLIKTDKNGNKLWDKTFGEHIDHDIANSVQQTTDGGYIIAGETELNGGMTYTWLIKTDGNGNKLWNTTHYVSSIQQTKDGGYILAGSNTLIKLGPDTMSVNLLKNPGFEIINGKLPQYWAKSQTGTRATFTYPAIGRVGGKSVAIRYATKETGKVALWQQAGMVVSPSKQYKLSGYMKLEGVTGGGTLPRLNGASLRINWYTPTGTLIKTDLIPKSGTIGWAKYEKIFTAPSNAAKANVGGDLFNAAGKVWFDDISLTLSS